MQICRHHCGLVLPIYVVWWCAFTLSASITHIINTIRHIDLFPAGHSICAQIYWDCAHIRRIFVNDRTLCRLHKSLLLHYVRWTLNYRWLFCSCSKHTQNAAILISFSMKTNKRYNSQPKRDCIDLEWVEKSRLACQQKERRTHGKSEKKQRTKLHSTN